MKVLIGLFIIIVLASTITPSELTAKFDTYVKTNNIMGLSVQITKNSNTIYKGNFGLRDYVRNLQVTNFTAFRMASLSKSITTAALFLLIEQGKLQLTDSVNKLIGFNITNPYYNNTILTV
jgi:CubicO group peptidase (beta-lactamase class C family)